jgi:hypothetical protein
VAMSGDVEAGVCGVSGGGGYVRSEN